MKKQIEVEISEKGEVKIIKSGFSGGSCEKETTIEDALGMVTSTQKTPEYYAKEKLAQKLGA